MKYCAVHTSSSLAPASVSYRVKYCKFVTVCNRDVSISKLSDSLCQRESYENLPLMANRKRRKVHCRTASVAEKVRESLEGEALEEWNHCVERVQALGVEAEKAETIVGQAFGWGKQAYWLNKKQEETPNLEQINSVLSYLEEQLQLGSEDLVKVVQKFPEVINCSVKKRLEINMEHMKKAYYMKEAAAINTVKRKPEVLGYTVDCEGNCEGFCNQCWVRL